MDNGCCFGIVNFISSSQRAFICNFREHWLTIRRLGAQWFNLNSLLTGPELISDTFLALTLAQLQRDGYSIYLVVGELPDCQVGQGTDSLMETLLLCVYILIKTSTYTG